MPSNRLTTSRPVPLGAAAPNTRLELSSSKNVKQAIGSRLPPMTDVGIASAARASALPHTNGPQNPAMPATSAPSMYTPPLSGLYSSSRNAKPFIIISTISVDVAMPKTPRPNTSWAMVLPASGSRVDARLKLSRLASIAASSRSPAGAAARAASSAAASPLSAGLAWISRPSSTL